MRKQLQSLEAELSYVGVDALNAEGGYRIKTSMPVVLACISHSQGYRAICTSYNNLDIAAEISRVTCTLLVIPK